jgi:predicted nucleic acid-binding Zn ribbon protein
MKAVMNPRSPNPTGSRREEDSTMRHEDDEDDDHDDWNEDDDADDDGYVPCPHCGEPMYEEAGYCSACETWISREDVPRKSMPAWMLLLVLMTLAGFVLSLRLLL